MILIFVTLRPFAVNTLTTLTAVALWCLQCHCRPLSLPLPHAGEVVESDPGVKALGDASRPHPGAGMSLPIGSTVYFCTRTSHAVLHLPVPPGQVVVVGVLLKSNTH